MPYIKAKKQLGQNFLNNEKIIKSLVESLNILEDDRIIEIGGGTGNITKHLITSLKEHSKLDIYEIDDDLIPILSELTSKHSNIRVVHENILDASTDSLSQITKIFGALPYYITSPIIHKILSLSNRPTNIVLIVQKEVGEKMIIKDPKASYWSYITAGYNVEKIMLIQRHNFKPSPNVDSIALLFTKNQEIEKAIQTIGFKKWEKFLHHVYKHPRKMIKKSFEISDLKKANIDPMNRPHDLSIEQLFNLYAAFYTE